MTVRVLVVEDDAGIRRVIERGLRVAGHDPTLAVDVAGARAAWDASAVDLVLLDVMLPDGNGLELLEERRRAGDRTPVILLSAREEAELHERAVAAGARDSLKKPFAYADLLAAIERATGAGGG